MEIKLNNQFYTKDQIIKAIGDFRDICSCQILDNFFTIKIDSKINKPYICEEFCNYVFSLRWN